MVRIPKPDRDEGTRMNSRSTAESGGTGAAEATAGTTVERELWAALETADCHETRFHLRQALQLVEADETRTE